MPITYQPPAPVGVFAGMARNQGPQGVPLSEQYAMEMQAKQANAAQQASLMSQDRQHGDQLDAQQRMFAGSQQFSPRDQGIAQSQMAEQQQRIQGQMQINQAELTQGENLRLQRLKQGQDMIRQQVNDKSITEAEGRLQMSQLNTPIQVLEYRKAASAIQQNDAHTAALKQQIETQRQVEIRKQKDDEARLQFSAASAEGKLKHIVDPGMASELTAKYSQQFPDMAPADIKASVEEELMAGGHFSTWYPNEKGVLQQAKTDAHGPQGTSSGGEGGTSSRGGKGGIPEFNPSQAYHDAEKAVDAMLTAGTIKPEQAQDEIMKRYNARKDVHGAFVGEKQAAANAGKAAPFNPNDLSTGTDPQKTQVAKLRNQIQQLQGSNLPIMVQQKASHDLQMAIKLTAEYADKDGRMDGKHVPPVVKREMAAINKRLQSLNAPTQQGPTLPDGPLTLEQKQAFAQQLQNGMTTGSVTDAAEGAAGGAAAVSAARRPAPAVYDRLKAMMGGRAHGAILGRY